jgi:hypothetical protein
VAKKLLHFAERCEEFFAIFTDTRYSKRKFHLIRIKTEERSNTTLGTQITGKILTKINLSDNRRENLASPEPIMWSHAMVLGDYESCHCEPHSTTRP